MLIGLIQPELSRQRARKLYTLFDQFLVLLCITSSSLHLPSIFFSLSISLLFLHCHVIFSLSVFFQDFLEKSASLLILKWKVTVISKIRKIFEVVGVFFYYVSQRGAIVIICNTISFFIANKLFIAPMAMTNLNFSPRPISVSYSQK